MKNKILSLALLICSVNGYAQEVKNKEILKFNKFETYNFQVENNWYVSSVGCKPNIATEYYSNQYGGHVVAKSKTDEFGNITTLFKAEDSLGFVINNSGISYLPQKEFVVKNILFTNDINNVHITYQATAPENNCEIQFLKSIDNIHFNLIKKTPIQVSQELINYSFNDEYNTVATYKIVIVKENTKKRFESKPYMINSQTDFYSVFPTITNNVVHINFQKIEESMPYSITNNVGQIVLKGNLLNTFNEIDLSALRNGMYFLNLLIENQNFSTKVSKN